MLTKEQWEALARFAGVDLTFDDDGAPLKPSRWMHYRRVVWQPFTDWNDFGPLWVKLERWIRNNRHTIVNDTLIYAYVNTFDYAIHNGTETELMQAGCALGAAIGATMKPALAADKETL